jgi:uncharacterized protein involved in response to NO
MEDWMLSVLVGTAALTAVAFFNFIECLRLAMQGEMRSFPHNLDQRYLVLLGWGFMVPIIWGFSARWLSAFLAIPKVDGRTLRLALSIDVLGVLCGIIGWGLSGTVLLALSAVVVILALHLVQKPNGPAKVLGIHPSFPSFIRIAYGWLVIAGGLSILAACADQHGGIWGASRHALTVGFAATMVFAISPRILPHFGGICKIFSTRMMFLSLLFLQVGCTLRVSFEPLAYEGVISYGWKVLPVSGVLELTGVLLFALNLAFTFLFGRSMFAQDNPPAPVTL